MQLRTYTRGSTVGCCFGGHGPQQWLCCPYFLLFCVQSMVVSWLFQVGNQSVTLVCFLACPAVCSCIVEFVHMRCFSLVVEYVSLLVMQLLEEVELFGCALHFWQCGRGFPGGMLSSRSGAVATC